MVNELVDKYPMDLGVITDLDPINWANEAENISETFVYNEIE